eukprot:15467749-Alexandrium_andersonii.AAC.1
MGLTGAGVVPIHGPPNLQHRVKHSDLELRGPGDGLEVARRSCRGVRSAPGVARYEPANEIAD